MTTLQANIGARNLDPMVTYNNPFQKNILKNSSEQYPSVSQINFLTQRLQKEVKPKKADIKKILRITVTTMSVTVAFLNLLNPTMAAGIGIATVATTASPEMIMPEDIMKLAKYLVGILAALGFCSAILLSMLAGGLNMFPNKKEKATKWMVEIIKGFSYLMVAPMIITLIAFAAYLLFGNSGWFVKLF